MSNDKSPPVVRLCSICIGLGETSYSTRTATGIGGIRKEQCFKCKGYGYYKTAEQNVSNTID